MSEVPISTGSVAAQVRADFAKKKQQIDDFGLAELKKRSYISDLESISLKSKDLKNALEDVSMIQIAEKVVMDFGHLEKNLRSAGDAIKVRHDMDTIRKSHRLLSAIPMADRKKMKLSLRAKEAIPIVLPYITALAVADAHARTVRSISSNFSASPSDKVHNRMCLRAILVGRIAKAIAPDKIVQETLNCVRTIDHKVSSSLTAMQLANIVNRSVLMRARITSTDNPLPQKWYSPSNTKLFRFTHALSSAVSEESMMAEEIGVKEADPMPIISSEGIVDSVSSLGMDDTSTLVNGTNVEKVGVLLDVLRKAEMRAIEDIRERRRFILSTFWGLSEEDIQVFQKKAEQELDDYRKQRIDLEHQLSSRRREHAIVKDGQVLIEEKDRKEEQEEGESTGSDHLDGQYDEDGISLTRPMPSSTLVKSFSHAIEDDMSEVESMFEEEEEDSSKSSPRGNPNLQIPLPNPQLQSSAFKSARSQLTQDLLNELMLISQHDSEVLKETQRIAVEYSTAQQMLKRSEKLKRDKEREERSLAAEQAIKRRTDTQAEEKEIERIVNNNLFSFLIKQPTHDDIKGASELAYSLPKPLVMTLSMPFSDILTSDITNTAGMRADGLYDGDGYALPHVLALYAHTFSNAMISYPLGGIEAEGRGHASTYHKARHSPRSHGQEDEMDPTARGESPHRDGLPRSSSFHALSPKGVSMSDNTRKVLQEEAEEREHRREELAHTLKATIEVVRCSFSSLLSKSSFLTAVTAKQIAQHTRERVLEGFFASKPVHSNEDTSELVKLKKLQIGLRSLLCVEDREDRAARELAKSSSSLRSLKHSDNSKGVSDKDGKVEKTHRRSGSLAHSQMDPHILSHPSYSQLSNPQNPGTGSKKNRHVHTEDEVDPSEPFMIGCDREEDVFDAGMEFGYSQYNQSFHEQPGVMPVSDLSTLLSGNKDHLKVAHGATKHILSQIEKDNTATITEAMKHRVTKPDEKWEGYKEDFVSRIKSRMSDKKALHLPRPLFDPKYLPLSHAELCPSLEDGITLYDSIVRKGGEMVDVLQSVSHQVDDYVSSLKNVKWMEKRALSIAQTIIGDKCGLDGIHELLTKPEKPQTTGDSPSGDGSPRLGSSREILMHKLHNEEDEKGDDGEEEKKEEEDEEGLPLVDRLNYLNRICSANTVDDAVLLYPYIVSRVQEAKLERQNGLVDEETDAY
ncbi:hypothetical protein ADUPG1_013854 [Aduncisulcus paluster]|uniref:Uncharacterized protein n=1 Tax=Aduncisulcus paluster TaxID=2918883 RepID=A0ABQ5K4G3_9EUKA|nr:hypothetical protein ADUPG1_013854 [Aduncisulcus paluster]